MSKKKVSAIMLCEEESCADYMNLAKRSGMPTVECIHLQLCSKCPQYTEEADLSLDFLKYLSGKGKSQTFFRSNHLNVQTTLRKCKKSWS